jgi:hypothetical protein
MVAGPNSVFICEECVTLFGEMFAGSLNGDESPFIGGVSG